VAILFLIRHGLTATTGRVLYGRADGISLDDRGRAQAERLAERFRAVRLTAIYSSPLQRCTETVEPLATLQRLPIVERPDLIEMDAGTWTGKTLPSLRRRRAWRDVMLAPSSFRFPGGESFREAHERVIAELGRIARRHARGRVAVATHGDIVRLLLGHLCGAPLDLFQRVVVETASVSVVQMVRGTPQVLLVNDTGMGLERFAPVERARGQRAGRNLRG
jgi:probable phosphomutase (TIGR03848 family)